MRATGTFEVSLETQPKDEIFDGPNLDRRTIDKRFRGDLAATSKGQMLSAVTATEGSAGYVAIERVSGTLHGRSGSFVLQHSSTMTRGVPRQSIAVVPDSGTGGLTGLAGEMTISVEGGNHAYLLEYTLPRAG